MKNITIRDVATAADVSISTVSRYLNGTANITPVARMRIEQAVRKLSFVPNAAARSLKQQQTHVIGILVSDIANPFFINICKALESLLSQFSYTLMICSSYEDRDLEARNLKAFFERRVDALVVSPTGKNNDLLLSIQHAGIPVIVIDRSFKDLQLNTIAEDTRAACQKITALLLAAGHKRVACLMGSEQSRAAFLRRSGIADAYAQAGMSLDNAVFYDNLTDENKAYQAMSQAFMEDKRATAVFATNPCITNGALLYLAEKRLDTPKDVSFACFSQKNVLYPWETKLTCVQQDPETIGLKVGEILIDLLEKKKNAEQPCCLLLEQKIVMGNSIADYKGMER